MDLNKVMLIGNLTRDPELRYTPNGQAVISFSLATNRRWTDKTTGEKKEQAEFHNIVAWGKLAETANQILKKGRKVYVEGRLQTRSWEDSEGGKKFRTEIIADNLIVLDRKTEGMEGEVIEEENLPETSVLEEENKEEEIIEENNSQETEKKEKDSKKSSDSSNNEEINVDDIPF